MGGEDIGGEEEGDGREREEEENVEGGEEGGDEEDVVVQVHLLRLNRVAAAVLIHHAVQARRDIRVE